MHDIEIQIIYDSLQRNVNLKIINHGQQPKNKIPLYVNLERSYWD